MPDTDRTGSPATVADPPAGLPPSPPCAPAQAVQPVCRLAGSRHQGESGRAAFLTSPLRLEVTHHRSRTAAKGSRITAHRCAPPRGLSPLPHVDTGLDNRGERDGRPIPARARHRGGQTRDHELGRSIAVVARGMLLGPVRLRLVTGPSHASLSSTSCCSRGPARSRMVVWLVPRREPADGIVLWLFALMLRDAAVSHGVLTCHGCQQFVQRSASGSSASRSGRWCRSRELIWSPFVPRLCGFVRQSAFVATVSGSLRW